MTDSTVFIKTLEEILAQKSEGEAKQYIVEHFAELPEELQQDIVVDMATDALSAERDELAAVSEFNKKVMQALTAWQIKKGDSPAD